MSEGFLGRYQVVGLLGQGGMGQVHLGFDPTLERYVAIKQIGHAVLHHPENATLLAYFEREARVVASLQHQNIIQIYEYGSPAGECAYIVTEFIDGVTFEDLMEDLGPLPADVMKVPHQGAATSDVEWLAASAPTLAIISVGPNDFGHPSENVIRVLEAAGADVRRTDRDGDVVVRLDRLVDAHPGVPLPSDP